MGCLQSKKKQDLTNNNKTQIPVLKSGFELEPKDFVIHHVGKFRDEYEKVITIGKGN